MALLEPGATLAHYRIIQKLGQGGQATAYRAEDLRLKRPVVVKILLPGLTATDAARRRFEREARLCSALDHPNICAVYDIGEAHGLCYIVMQFVDGQTLKQLIVGRPLATLLALSIAIQMADALATAHAHGIVHRDVKPSNVIVGSRGQVKMLDFGLAKALADDGPSGTREIADTWVTEVGMPSGTSGYGSPEQVSGGPVDPRTDVFSLGVVVYEMMAGRPPFRGRHAIELLHAVIHDTPRPVAELNPDAPPRLQAILDRALAKEPRDRQPTMATLRDELKALMRELSQETGLVPTEASTTLLAPSQGRTAWMLAGALGRVFGRLRSASRPPDRHPRPDPGQPPRPSDPSGAWSPLRGREARNTIAVLPFRNLSGDRQADFYEFSLADVIITELAQLRSLVVRPSAYVARYAGQHVDPRQVGEDLAVAAVLTGTFIKVPDRFRVTAQLVATATGEIIWSEKIAIAAADLLTIEDTIAERVIAGLRVKLTDEEQARIDRPVTRSAEAYELYLRGRDLLFQYVARTLDDHDLEVAIRMFGEAVRLDPGFARAHAALGRSYVHHAQGYGGPEYYALAERSLRQALELDPALASARLQMVHVDLHRGDKGRAHATLAELRREVPNDPMVALVAAMLYRLDGLYEEALAQYDRLLELNPRDTVIVSWGRARIYTHQRRYDAAIAELERGGPSSRITP